MPWKSIIVVTIVLVVFVAIVVGEILKKKKARAVAHADAAAVP